MADRSVPGAASVEREPDAGEERCPETPRREPRDRFGVYPRAQRIPTDPGGAAPCVGCDRSGRAIDPVRILDSRMMDQCVDAASRRVREIVRPRSPFKMLRRHQTELPLDLSTLLRRYAGPADVHARCERWRGESQACKASVGRDRDDREVRDLSTLAARHIARRGFRCLIPIGMPRHC
jgi:hypothetical protein